MPEQTLYTDFGNTKPVTLDIQDPGNVSWLLEAGQVQDCRVVFFYGSEVIDDTGVFNASFENRQGEFDANNFPLITAQLEGNGQASLTVYWTGPQDTEGPEITIDTAESCDWTNHHATSFLAKDPSNVIKIEYCFSESSSTPTSGWATVYEDSTGTSSWYGSVTPYNSGQWYLHIRATDKKNNVSLKRSTGMYKIDKIVPTFSVNISSRDWSSSSVSVTINTSYGPSGLSSSEYAWSTSTSPPSTGWSLLSNGSGIVAKDDSGVWYLYLRATSNSGAGNADWKGPYKIDKTPPSISISPSSQSSGGKTSAEISATDSQSGLDAIQYSLTTSTSRPSSGWTVISFKGQEEAEMAVEIANGGTWYLHVEANDNAGNKRHIYGGPYVIHSYKDLKIMSSYFTNLRDTINEYRSHYDDTSIPALPTSDIWETDTRIEASNVQLLRDAIEHYRKESIPWVDTSLHDVKIKAEHIEQLQSELNNMINSCWTCDVCDIEGCSYCDVDYGCGSDGYYCIPCDSEYSIICECNVQMCNGDHHTCPANIFECSSCVNDSIWCQCYGPVGQYTPCNCHGDAGCNCDEETCNQCNVQYNRIG